MPNVIFKVENTKLAAEGEDLQRIATRIPADLRQSLKIRSAVMGVGLNALYAVILREFLALAVRGKTPVSWKKPSTSPRLDRKGAPRGDAAWVQVLMILPTPLIQELEEVCAQYEQSLASVGYTALDWYTEQQVLREQKAALVRKIK